MALGFLDPHSRSISKRLLKWVSCAVAYLGKLYGPNECINALIITLNPKPERRLLFHTLSRAILKYAGKGPGGDRRRPWLGPAPTSKERIVGTCLTSTPLSRKLVYGTWSLLLVSLIAARDNLKILIPLLIPALHVCRCRTLQHEKR
jgi:hypothetical protein